MYDVFYCGPKPNLFAFERPATGLKSAQAQAKTKYFWYINGDNDYSNFDFGYQPVPWESAYTHVWPSQWQQNGGTYLVPTDTAEFQWHWHDDVKVTRRDVPQVFYMDFMNDGSAELLENLKNSWPDAEFKSVRYVDSHLNVFKRIVNLAKTEYVWIISSICDYKNFDLTWHHPQWQEHMVHVFPTNNLKRGDTFYLRCDSFKQQAAELELLDWFNVINYCTDQKAKRLPAPVHRYLHDNLIEAVKGYEFKFPYATFTRTNGHTEEYATPCVWSEQDRSVESLNHSSSTVIIPRDIKVHLRTQIYDYPYINVRKKGESIHTEDDLDIVYISNGEPEAERWYDHLCDIIGQETTSFPMLKFANIIKRVKNVNGRMEAYKAAAKKSETPWFFAVFAKLEVVPEFDWTWQPDWLQEPKHYIFHSRNPVNRLEYGHQAMIAYNKRLVLETVDSGLDFTLSKAHEVVPILSGTAHYDQDAWTTWRTAFREVVKLKHFSITQPNVETEFRLKKWLTVGNGDFGEWSIRGAQDAIEYYTTVNGDYNKLMLSYEWAWLKQYYAAKY